MVGIIRKAGRVLQRDVHALILVAQDRRVPWYAKALAVAVVAYALSPIDLIPDFIPFIGSLDDLVIVPFGMSLVMRMIPAHIMAEHRATALETRTRLKYWIAGALLIIALWIFAVILTFWLLYRWLGTH